MVDWYDKRLLSQNHKLVIGGEKEKVRENERNMEMQVYIVKYIDTRYV